MTKHQQLMVIRDGLRDRLATVKAYRKSTALFYLLQDLKPHTVQECVEHVRGLVPENIKVVPSAYGRINLNKYGEKSGTFRVVEETPKVIRLELVK